ncbi:ATP-dependent DNA ligase [Burkholderia vietnamiensis]|uniref:ATP-dependent DNA ligase n=1 Tax=Burkholderia vietnamiensis TaxID=60552 RepID=UPI00075F36DE|nr:ATP-dependent DNA ligase [Burkholderia vietnamiensis]KVR95825.1 ATP-dependent DNA ligase [Burkholderia vietnamiensis]
MSTPKGIPEEFRPNLAATLTKPELIKFPVYASPKIDGIRCVFFGGVAYSRSLKPIPNPNVQAYARAFSELLEGLDGEITVGSPTDPNCMQNSMAVMSKTAKPEFTFHVFDTYWPGVDFSGRMLKVEQHIAEFYVRYPEVDIRLVPQHYCVTHDELDSLESRFLADGYEGMMIRSHKGIYKCGRSTEREGGLVKVKRFVDAEAVVIGFEEEMHNGNECTRDALGRTERSSVASGLVGKGTLGALCCRSGEGVEFNIGTGFSADMRRDLWNTRDSLVGRFVTFKYFSHGVKEAPRHPVFKSFRAPEDMS